MTKFILFFLFSALTFGQTNTYNVSFENPVHHEAFININFPNLRNNNLTVMMSRSSPGRYALHEFAKNVYNLKATNSKGEILTVDRPDPYSWEVKGHDGTVNLSYTLFADRADGTYSQVDETHAHFNIPATFMYAKELEHRPIEINFNTPENLNWKIATQLKEIDPDTYYAPDLYYFMDSPIELSDFDLREFEINGQIIRFALHHQGSGEEFNQYFKQVKRIVEQEKMVFGELPNYDYGKYTFLACYMPNVSGDGMEHRNSTVLTDVTSLADGGMKENIGTVSHEYLHSWNVERIRPSDLEPFDFSKTNMSGSLWFAEGFTSYYTNLILNRAQIISPEDYVESLNKNFNYVWNSPARAYFNPVEMSYQAPFVDAATSVDPVNRENTFISYYSYGSVLGLALDLSLREKGQTLDDFMKLMWLTYGKTEISYTLQDLQKTLGTFAGETFASHFFDNYIYKSEMPDYRKLFELVGLNIIQKKNEPYFGAPLKNGENTVVISGNPNKNSPAYNALLSNGDELKSIDTTILSDLDDWKAIIKNKRPGDTVEIGYVRNGIERKTSLSFSEGQTYSISIDNNANKTAIERRQNWLKRSENFNKI
ncbi:MAG: M61 family metallopeptidase [Flavobacteriaceae bacterium]|nr:M61 family metallopeptidase [Flavobacteriaceae bacterium]